MDIRNYCKYSFLFQNPDESSVALNDDTERVDVLLEAIAEQASTSDSS